LLPSLFLFALPRISPHFWCSAFSLFISMVKTKATTKSQKGKQKRIEFVREVAAEVSALQAAERRRAADERAQLRKGPRVIVNLDPGNSPPPSDSDEAELLENFRAGQDPFAPGAGRSPFNVSQWRQGKVPLWAEMPWIVPTTLGLMCLICAGVTAVKTGCKWSEGTACPSKIKGQAQQHCKNAKHNEAMQAARDVSALRHLLPIDILYPWAEINAAGTKCTLCEAAHEPKYGPWRLGEEPSAWVLGRGSKQRADLDAHERSPAHRKAMPQPVAPPQASPERAPRKIPAPLVRATVNTYGTLKAGKGYRFFREVARLDHVKHGGWGMQTYHSTATYERLRRMIIRQGKKRTRAAVRQYPALALILDAGTRRSAKSEPLAVLVRNLDGEVFVGVLDMDSEAAASSTDCDRADAAAYFRCVQDIFEKWDIPWELIEKRFVAVVSDGATVMGSLWIC
jgi:hypothetical protein